MPVGYQQMMDMRCMDIYVLLHLGTSWRTFRTTTNSIVASCDNDFAPGFLSLAVRQGKLQR